MNNLFLNIFISAIGLGYFVYGRKMVYIPFIVCGLILCIYPYLVADTSLMIIIGVVFIAAPFLLKRYF